MRGWDRNYICICIQSCPLTDGFGKKMIKLMSLVATNRLVSRTFFQIMHSVPTEHNGVAWFAVTFGLNQKCIYTQLSL